MHTEKGFIFKSAEGVTLSGVLDTKLYADTTLESLVKSSAEGARKYFRISQAKGQGGSLRNQ